MTELALVRVEPTPDAFAEAVSGVVRRGAGSLAVLPDDAFAKELRDRVPRVQRADPDHADILCLTYRLREPLEEALHAQLDRTKGTVIIPRVVGHGLDRPLFLISIPKAGTHLLYRLAEQLGFHPAVICPEIPAPANWYCLEYSNSHTVPRDFFVELGPPGAIRQSDASVSIHPCVVHRAASVGYSGFGSKLLCQARQHGLFRFL